jgi:hypothetical protein
VIRRWLPKAQPHIPPDYDEQVIYAIRAWSQGKASENQQMLAWDYVMYVTGASEEFNDLSYRPDKEGGTRAMDFAEGKRFVGLMIRKMLRPEVTPRPQIAEDDVSRAVKQLAARRAAAKRGK